MPDRQTVSKTDENANKNAIKGMQLSTPYQGLSMGLANRVSNIVYNQPLVLGKWTDPGQLVVVIIFK